MTLGAICTSTGLRNKKLHIHCACTFHHIRFVRSQVLNLCNPTARRHPISWKKNAIAAAWSSDCLVGSKQKKAQSSCRKSRGRTDMVLPCIYVHMQAGSAVDPIRLDRSGCQQGRGGTEGGSIALPCMQTWPGWQVTSAYQGSMHACVL